MRPRPVEVFSFSKGKNKFVFQDILYNNEKYLYLKVNGELKTKIYNQSVIDGSKKPLKLMKAEEYLVPKTRWLLAIPKENIEPNMLSKDKKYFVGKIGAVKTYILHRSNIETFGEYTCTLTECPFEGQKDCFLKNPKDCSEPNRERHAVGRYSYKSRKSQKKKLLNN